MAKKNKSGSNIPKTINDGKGYKKNPRSITEGQFEFLRQALEEFGDLSGIVHDLRTNEFVGGNQRSRIFSIEEAEIDITTTYDTPTPTGTVAEGYVLYKGERYTYRGVYWDDLKIERANLIANKAGGSFNWDMLANAFDVDVMLASGFAPQEIYFTPPPPMESFGIGGGPGKADKEEAKTETFSQAGDWYDISISLTSNTDLNEKTPFEMDRIVKHLITYCSANGISIAVCRNDEALNESETKYFLPAETAAISS